MLKKETIALLRHAASIETVSLNLVFILIEREVCKLRDKVTLKKHKLIAHESRITIDALDLLYPLDLAQKNAHTCAHRQLITALDILADHNTAIIFFQSDICTLALILLKLTRNKVSTVLKMAGTPIPRIKT